MIKTCGFKAIDRFVDKGIWLSVKSVESILRDAGFHVVACRVEGQIPLPIVDIGYSDEHYYNLIGSDKYPQIVFALPHEMSDKLRPLILEEKERTKGGKGSVSVVQPSVPAAPSSGESMKEWAEAMPQVYETQLEYAPKEAAQQLDLLQQYAAPTAHYPPLVHP